LSGRGEPAPVGGHRIAYWKPGLLLTMALVLGSCGSLGGSYKTLDSLNHAGFYDAKITTNPNSISPSLILLTAKFNKKLCPTVPSSKITANGSCVPSYVAQEDAASIIWSSYPYYFTELEIQINQVPTVAYTLNELDGSFGPRPTTLARQSVQTIALSPGSIAFVILLGLAILVFLFVSATSRSSSRKIRKARPKDLFTFFENLEEMRPGQATSEQEMQPGQATSEQEMQQGQPTAPGEPQPGQPSCPPDEANQED
jgi:hypothetical protein